MPRVVLTVPALLLVGCYSIGFAPQPGLLGSTIAIPVFGNETLRRHVEHALTREVRRELQETTTVQLESESEATMVLRGRITAVQEGVLLSGPAEEVVYSAVTVNVQFGVYEESRLVLGEDTKGDGIPDAEIALEGYAEFQPARGESRETATVEALADLAEMIVARLTRREDDRFEPNNTYTQAAALRPGRQDSLQQHDSDWFRLAVPARHALRATIFFSTGGLRLKASDPTGSETPGALVRDEGRLLTMLAGEEQRTVLLEVTGDDRGALYRMVVEVLRDDWLEPNDGPDQASPLAPGQAVHLLQRNDDWFAVTVPAGRGLRASLPGQGTLTLRACDPDGALLPDAVQSDDERTVTVPAQGADRLIHLLVSGDDAGLDYRLETTLDGD